jgi:hypothetical protein
LVGVQPQRVQRQVQPAALGVMGIQIYYHQDDIREVIGCFGV